MINTFLYEDGQDNLFDEKGKRVYDPMEAVLIEINDPNIVLETLTSKNQYLEKKNLLKNKKKKY